jgi:hypothetical protein
MPREASWPLGMTYGTFRKPHSFVPIWTAVLRRPRARVVKQLLMELANAVVDSGTGCGGHAMKAAKLSQCGRGLYPARQEGTTS